MKDFRSNEEFFAALRTLLDRLCDDRQFAALAQLLPGYLAFNGLGDGWHELLNALKATRGLGGEGWKPQDWDDLNDLVHAANLAVLKAMEIEVDLYLYPTERSGRTVPVLGNYRPLGFLRIDPTLGPDGTQAHALFFKLGDNPIKPGESRRVTCSFHHRPSFDAFMEAKKLYVWDGQISGEIVLVENPADRPNSN